MELTKESVLNAIATNDSSCVNALIKLYARQTADEQQAEMTGHDNGVGFNGTDAPFLSSLAKQAIQRRADREAGNIPSHYTDLSPKQVACARKLLKKYGRQLLAIAQETQEAKAARQSAAPIIPQSAAVYTQLAKPTEIDGFVVSEIEELPDNTSSPLAHLPSGLVEVPGGWRWKTAREFLAEGVRLSLPVQGTNGLARSAAEPISEFERAIGVGA